jgi:hypothetical protein
VRLLLVTLLLLATPADKLWMDVSAAVVMAGGELRVRCHVPELPPASYQLEIGITGYTVSVRDVPGTPWTPEMWFLHLPCEADEAYCALNYPNGDSTIVKAQIVITGCQ